MKLEALLTHGLGCSEFFCQEAWSTGINVMKSKILLAFLPGYIESCVILDMLFVLF
jgi:hypothetical protein